MTRRPRALTLRVTVKDLPPGTGAAAPVDCSTDLLAPRQPLRDVGDVCGDDLELLLSLFEED
jgi:hypothetical protein